MDNTIGGTPQPNGWCGSWVEFFRERRLRHQLQLAGDPALSRLGDKLLGGLDAFFEGVEVGGWDGTAGHLGWGVVGQREGGSGSCMPERGRF